MLRISVVTPSLEQVTFLEDSITSVLGQEYADLEFLVLDGGSLDGSRDVIRKYEERLAFWRSEPDNGQAAAINEGFRRATGEVFCWLNSDDYFLPGTLRQVGNFFSGRTDEPLVAYGGAFVFQDDGSWGTYHAPVPFDAELLRRKDFIVQPSAFWTRAAWERVGELDESLRFVFDWEWFLRGIGVVQFEILPGCLAGYRIHSEHKSGKHQAKRREELMKVLQHYGSPEVVRHYEFLRNHPNFWNALKRWGNVADALQRNGVPKADAAAAVLTPGTWSIPRDLDYRTLLDGVFFL